MKIASLTLSNFRNMPARAFTFAEPRVLVLGPNAAGKSTVFDAIRWCLTGRCRGLDGAGRGAEALRFDQVAKATTPMSVEAVVLHNGETRTVTRTFDGKSTTFKVSGMSGTGGDQFAAFLLWLGVTVESLSIALDAELFFALTHGDAKSFLLGFLNIQIPLPDGSTVPFDELEGRYQEAYRNRADANRDVKNAPVGQPPTQAVGDIPGARSLLERLQHEKDDLVRQKGVMDGGQMATAKEASRLAQQLDGLQKARLRAVGEYPTLTLDEARGHAEAPLPHIDAAGIEIVRLSQPGPDEQATGVDFAALTEQAVQLEAHAPTKGCVLSPSVSCPVAKKSFVKAASDIRASLMAAASAHEATVVRETARAAAVEHRANLIHDREAWLSVVEQLQMIETTIAEVTAQHTAAVANLPPDAGQTSTIDQQIAVLTDRIAKGSDLLKKYEAAARDHQAYGERRDAKKALEKIAQEWDAKVTLYGSEAGSLRARALATGVHAFETTINAALEPFGFVFKVSIEPWGLVVNDRPLVALSMSERLRVATAFQLAVAVTSGVSFTLVDQIDALLSAPRGLLTRLILEAPLEQVIVAKAQEPTAPLPTFQSGGVQVVAL